MNQHVLSQQQRYGEEIEDLKQMVVKLKDAP